MRLVRALRAAAIVSSVVLVGCGGHARPQVAAVAPPAPTPRPAAAPAATPKAESDPIAALIATSERHFAAGQREAEQGHLDKARIEFDRAVNVLLESPYGARSDARLRDHFDRLVDRISAREVTALAEGDGFSEKPSEPASIDELLAIATFEPPKVAAPETTAVVQADLESTQHDIPIPLNDRVLSYIELFQGRLRGHLQAGIERGTQYLPMIQQVLRAEGLPLDLAYIPLIESAFKPTALSNKKAKGVWQFMKPTAADHGLQTNWFIDERADPEKATVAAAKYLKTLYGMFDDWHLAMASYNGGPGRMQRAVKRSGIDNFWQLTSSTRYLPRETREYVPMILAAIVIAKNPTRYGFETPAGPVTRYEDSYEKVEVPRAVDLRRVAEWAGTSIEQIQTLNPELRRWTTPLRYPSYEVKVPAGTGERLRTRLVDAKASELAVLNWYRVKGGESLTTISRKLRVSRADLAEANGLTAKSRVRPGQELIIPRAPTTLLASRPGRAAETTVAAVRPKATERSAAADRTTVAEKTTDTAAFEEVSTTDDARVVYRVKRGDTLSSIARAFETTVAAIKRSNRLLSNRITIGDRLTINTARQTTRSTQ
jgi:membrane-bound lytic murein transglycosylase D